jgi:cytochrome c peroxidase
MTKPLLIRLTPLIAAFALAAPLAFAADDSGASPGAQITRPAGYKPIAGDAKLGEKLFNDTQLSTNGMACATCHANHGAFQASFAKPYPHTVQMAQEQLGRKSVHLDEMIQACMVMPMAAKPLPWDSKALAALVAYVQIQQKSFKPSALSTN